MCVNASLNMKLAAGGSSGLPHVSPHFFWDRQLPGLLTGAYKGKSDRGSTFQPSAHPVSDSAPLAKVSKPEIKVRAVHSRYHKGWLPNSTKGLSGDLKVNNPTHRRHYV